MNETKDKPKEIDGEFHTIQKKFLVELTQEFGSDLGPKKICKTVAKWEKLGNNKINKITDQSFNKNFERIVDRMQNDIKSNEIICQNNIINNKTVNQTVDNIIESQTKIEKINESIVEKTVDLNEIKSEESRLQPIKQLLSNENDIRFDTIKNQLKQS